jgi:hypothetical protein
MNAILLQQLEGKDSFVDRRELRRALVRVRHQFEGDLNEDSDLNSAKLPLGTMLEAICEALGMDVLERVEILGAQHALNQVWLDVVAQVGETDLGAVDVPSFVLGRPGPTQ